MQNKPSCQNCGTECEEVLDLGNQPLCNRNMKSKEEFKIERRYPIGMWVCPRCFLAQQPQELPTSLLFPPEFNYLSSSSRQVAEFYGNLAARYIKEFRIRKGDCVVEIASNDGPFLKPFRKREINVLGIDPAQEASRNANRDGVYTITKDFETAEPYVKKATKGKVRLVAAFDVLAHTGRIHGFLDAVADLLKANPKAVFVSQSHYLPRLIENCEWDTLYSEHQKFYTLTSLRNLLSRHRLHIYDAEETDFYGGSFLAYASLTKKPESFRMLRLLQGEKRYCTREGYLGFREKVHDSAKLIRQMLRHEKIQGHTIVGIGQPMKSSVLLNYCGIDDSIIKYLTETNPLKIGTFAPGSHIPIINEEDFLASADNNPDTLALILSWNMKDIIMKKLRERGFKGRFMIPIPFPELVID